MKHLIIIGARGAGRETFLTATKSFGYGHEFDIKGFLDGKTDALDGLPGYPPILSSVESYQVEEGEDGDTVLSFDNLSRMAREPKLELQTYREDVSQK